LEPLNDTECDDNDICTKNDQCNGGKCIGEPLENCFEQDDCNTLKQKLEDEKQKNSVCGYSWDCKYFYSAFADNCELCSQSYSKQSQLFADIVYMAEQKECDFIMPCQQCEPVFSYSGFCEESKCVGKSEIYFEKCENIYQLNDELVSEIKNYSSVLPCDTDEGCMKKMEVYNNSGNKLKIYVNEKIDAEITEFYNGFIEKTGSQNCFDTNSEPDESSLLPMKCINNINYLGVSL
jgi:hypothetical protein